MMKIAVWSLAFLASVGPAFAIPGFNRAKVVGEIKTLEREIAELQTERAGWGKHSNWGYRNKTAVALNGTATGWNYTKPASTGGWGQGGSWGYGGQPGGNGNGQGGAPGHEGGSSSESAQPSSTAGEPQTSIDVSPVTEPASSTITAVPWGMYTPPGWSSSPAETITTISDFVTTYTAVAPAASEYTYGSSTLTSSYYTTSTVTTSYKTTLTFTASAGSTSAPSSNSPSGHELASSSTRSLAPDGEFTVTSSDAGSSTDAPVPYGSYTPSGYIESTSIVTTEYATTCDESSVYTTGSSTLTTTYTTVSTVTSTYETTVTLSADATSSSPLSPVTQSSSNTGASPSSSVTALGYGGSSSSSIGSPSSAPVAPAYGASSSTASGLPSYSANASSSVVGPASYGSGSSSSAAGPYPTGSYGTNSSSSVAGPYPTGSYGSGSSSSVVGTGSVSSSLSGAVPYSANSTTSKPYGTGSSSSETSFTTFTSLCTQNGSQVFHTHSAPVTTAASSTIIPYSAGNSTSALGSTGTGVSKSSSSTSSTCSTKATSTAACIPCHGQPGSDPDSFCGYTALDNSYEVMPITCVTREYDFEVTNTTLSPDGIERLVLVVNGQMPGPLIEANWGDEIVVNVKNSMQNNGSTIHWHGQRQNYTNEMDGVASITQCPIAPGESMTYRFKASNYGTSWYHSHYAIQTYEGVFGPMIIHGPSSSNVTYEAEEMIVLQDWNHVGVDSMYDAAQDVGSVPTTGDPTLDTGLINGMNIWGTDGAANATGERFSMTVTKGKTYLLRLVNTAIQSTFAFYIDSHTMTVIANDFVPIVPYETDVLFINIGQRYDVLVTFDQDVGDYWLRSDVQQACSTILYPDNIKGIVHYEGGADGVPTSTANTYTSGCQDEPYASLVPYAAMTVGDLQDEITETVTIGANGGTPNLYKWSLSGTTFESKWDDPTLLDIVKNGSIPSYSGNLAIEVPNLNEWVYVIIDTPIPFPHPIHLHGHDFYVLAQGTGNYTSAVELNLVNPPRRDVAMLPWDPTLGLGGYLVVAFITDNPGVWLMHCHIGWHAAMGFALQIIENLDGIKDTVTNECLLEETCKAYNAYATEYDIITTDSGI